MFRMVSIRTASLVFLFGILLLFTGVAQAQYPTTENPTPNLDRIIKSGKIVVGTIPDYVPFQMIHKNGELFGYNIDIMKDMAAELGVELEIKQPAFPVLIPSLDNGEIDMIIMGMAITPKRALAVDFSIPYFHTGYCLLVNKKHEGELKTLDDFNKAGIILGAMMGTPTVDEAQKACPQAKVKEFNNMGTAFMALLAGQVDAIFVDEAIALYLSLMQPDKTFPIYEKLTNNGHGIAIKKGQPDLLLWINTYLRDYMDSPDYKRAYDKYFTDHSWWEELSPSMKGEK